jgi:thioredoxin 1
MRIASACIGFLLLATACGESKSTEEARVLLTPQEFQDKFTPDASILDVRTPEEFTSGNLPNSMNIDFKNSEFEANILLLDKEKTYLVYCASGVRSGQAVDFMKKEGFKNVFALDGGLNAWKQANMPMH